MKIAYIGIAAGTSLQRAKALQRLGHDVRVIDPLASIRSSKWLGRFHYHTGYVGVEAFIGNSLINEVTATNPNLVWINQGEFLGARLVKRLGQFGVPLINYAGDNPFSSENRRRFSKYRAALPHYDLVVVVFQEAVELAKSAGAKCVIRRFQSADEEAHCRLPMDGYNEPEKFDVSFVGTWMKEQRGPLIAELIRLGVPLSVWGEQWSKAKEWTTIKPFWRGPGVYDDEGYARLLRASKICLGLVNKTSGNLHTERSIQIPALGSLLCAERTSEHLEMYEDGKEAVFWSTPEECAALCKHLLSDEDKRSKIAARGHERAIRNGFFNEPVMGSILKELNA